MVAALLDLDVLAQLAAAAVGTSARSLSGSPIAARVADRGAGRRSRRQWRWSSWSRCWRGRGAGVVTVSAWSRCRRGRGAGVVAVPAWSRCRRPQLAVVAMLVADCRGAGVPNSRRWRRWSRIVAVAGVGQELERVADRGADRGGGKR